MSSQQKLLVIMGATGSQGGSVLSTLTGASNWRIRALTRNTNSSSAKALASLPNVEVASCSISDPASLRAAFSGASAIFAVTDFWGILSSLVEEVKTGKKVNAQNTLNEQAREIEVQYAKNIFNAAAKVRGLERLVWSSLPYTAKHTGGKYLRCYHFDGKASATEYLLGGGSGGELKALAAKTNVVWIGCYAENHANMGPFKIQKAADGSFVLRLPLSPTSNPFPYIIASTQTGLFVKALLSTDQQLHPSLFKGTALRASTITLSPVQFMEVWSRTLKLPGRFEEISMEKFAASIEDEGLKGEVVDTLGAHGDFGYFGGNEEVEASVGPEEIGIVTPGIEGLQDWIRTADWSSIIGKKSDLAG